MKILMLKDYFNPEKCAGITMTNDLLEGFIENNLDVVVFTPIPCRGLDDLTRKEYRRKKEEYYGGAKVYRYWLPYEAKNTILRAFRYILQNIIQLIKGLNCKCDVIFLGSTPPTMGLVGTILKKIKKVPFVYNLQDVFPDSLVNTGITEEGTLIWKIGCWIERCTYKNADKIIVISEDFKNNLVRKGVPKDKIEVIYNWVDMEQIKPVQRKDNNLFHELQLDVSKYIVVYAGNFGASQGADIIIDVAKELMKHENIQFVVFGGGTEYADFKKKVRENALSNIIVNDLMPIERISEVYSMGDVSLITSKPGVGISGMPSKTWSIMACNTPIIASFDLKSELARILSKAKAGINVEPGDAKQLAEAIVYLKNIGTFKTNTRGYVEENSSKDRCVERYIKVIKSCKIKENI